MNREIGNVAAACRLPGFRYVTFELPVFEGPPRPVAAAAPAPDTPPEPIPAPEPQAPPSAAEAPAPVAPPPPRPERPGAFLLLSELGGGDVPAARPRPSRRPGAFHALPGRRPPEQDR